MNIIDFALSKARVFVGILVFIIVSGAATYITIPKESTPDVNIPIIYVSLSQTGISADTAITKIEVDGDINKVKLNQAITGNLAVGTIISIGRTDVSNPFASNVNTTLFSTVGRVNTVSQFFYDAACTQVFDLINSDNSGSLFKLYNQNTSGPNFISYSTASGGSPESLDDLMPLPPDKPIGSVRLDGGGNIVDLGANTPNRGLSPIAQELNA